MLQAYGSPIQFAAYVQRVKTRCYNMNQAYGFTFAYYNPKLMT